MGNLGFQENLLIIFISFGIILIPAIFYLITLQNALKSVDPDNRTMEPGKVWLLFIPLFNIVWIFIVINAIAVSFKNQYERYGLYKGDKPTYGIGLAMCILEICSFLPFVSLAALVCWIIHWVQVTQHKNELTRLKAADRLSDQPSIFN